jgi:hypothetical protein
MVKISRITPTPRLLELTSIYALTPNLSSTFAWHIDLQELFLLAQVQQVDPSLGTFCVLCPKVFLSRVLTAAASPFLKSTDILEPSSLKIRH